MKKFTSLSACPLCFIALLLLLPACSDLPDQYSAEAVEAWVLDSETKEPLADVIVVANWKLHAGSLDGRKPGGQLMVMETVTDKDGRFSFPAWGPKRRPFNTFLHDSDPLILLFKPGYEYEGLQNPLKSYVNNDPVRRSIWNGKTIEVQSFKGSLDSYMNHLSSTDTSIRSIVGYDKGCLWKKIPELQAVNNSSIVKEPGLLKTLGLKKMQDDKIFPNSNNKRNTIRELVRFGARFEDDSPRFINHFYDPLQNRPLQNVSPFNPEISPDWALEDNEEIGGQDYSYRNALDYFYEALTIPTGFLVKADEKTRKENFGRTFQTLGQVIHHIQDMAQPQHVRLDEHGKVRVNGFTGEFTWHV